MTNNEDAPAGPPAGAARLAGAADAVSLVCGRVGALLLVAITLMLSMDVVLRYVFNAPTIWAQDVAVAFQVWFTYLGMAYVLRRGQMIRIVALLAHAPAGVRKLAEAFSLLVILGFSCIAVVYGWGIVVDSIELGRRQPTMLQMPNWISELPVVVGFALLGVQAVANLVRLPFVAAPEFSFHETPDHGGGSA